MLDSRANETWRPKRDIEIVAGTSLEVALIALLARCRKPSSATPYWVLPRGSSTCPATARGRSGAMSMSIHAMHI